MYGTCSVCGVDFSLCPEQLCAACELNGVGICIKCASLGSGSLYCRVCAANILDADEEVGYESITE